MRGVLLVAAAAAAAAAAAIKVVVVVVLEHSLRVFSHSPRPFPSRPPVLISAPFPTNYSPCTCTGQGQGAGHGSGEDRGAGGPFSGGAVALLALLHRRGRGAPPRPSPLRPAGEDGPGGAPDRRAGRPRSADLPVGPGGGAPRARRAARQTLYVNENNPHHWHCTNLIVTPKRVIHSDVRGVADRNDSF